MVFSDKWRSHSELLAMRWRWRHLDEKYIQHWLLGITFILTNKDDAYFLEEIQPAELISEAETTYPSLIFHC